MNLTPEQVHEALRYDSATGKLYWRERNMPKRRGSASWNPRYAGKEALTTVSRKGYLGGTICGVSVAAHRVVWLMAHGRWPKEIDHIDGNPANNRLSNLREVTGSQNCRNRARRRALPLGVYPRRDGGVGYVAAISWRENGEKNSRHLGSFPTLEDAAKARAEAERLHGFHPNHGRLALANGAAPR